MKEFLDKLHGVLDAYRVKKVEQCWALASREEQQRRLRLVLDLAVELDRIKKVNIFQTRIGEGAIEAVIEGDWKHVRQYVGHLSMEDEKKNPLHYEWACEVAVLWEPFAMMLETGCVEAERVEKSYALGAGSEEGGRN